MGLIKFRLEIAKRKIYTRNVRIQPNIFWDNFILIINKFPTPNVVVEWLALI